MDNLEIERKYLIRMPERALLADLPFSEIEQIYLLTAEGEKARVRRRVYRDGTTELTHTVKKRLSELSRVETEEEISEAEFERSLTSADPARSPLRKTRYLLEYRNQLFEIDCFPFWTDRALMEIELRSESQPIELPPAIRIVREVTFDKRYSNHAIAREIPREEL